LFAIDRKRRDRERIANKLLRHGISWWFWVLAGCAAAPFAEVDDTVWPEVPAAVPDCPLPEAPRPAGGSQEAMRIYRRLVDLHRKVRGIDLHAIRTQKHPHQWFEIEAHVCAPAHGSVRVYSHQFPGIQTLDGTLLVGDGRHFYGVSQDPPESTYWELDDIGFLGPWLDLGFLAPLRGAEPPVPEYADLLPMDPAHPDWTGIRLGYSHRTAEGLLTLTATEEIWLGPNGLPARTSITRKVAPKGARQFPEMARGLEHGWAPMSGTVEFSRYEVETDPDPREYDADLSVSMPPASFSPPPEESSLLRYRQPEGSRSSAIARARLRKHLRPYAEAKGLRLRGLRVYFADTILGQTPPGGWRHLVQGTFYRHGRVDLCLIPVAGLVGGSEIHGDQRGIYKVADSGLWGRYLGRDSSAVLERFDLLPFRVFFRGEARSFQGEVRLLPPDEDLPGAEGFRIRETTPWGSLKEERLWFDRDHRLLRARWSTGDLEGLGQEEGLRLVLSALEFLSGDSPPRPTARMPRTTAESPRFEPPSYM